MRVEWLPSVSVAVRARHRPATQKQCSRGAQVGCDGGAVDVGAKPSCRRLAGRWAVGSSPPFATAVTRHLHAAECARGLPVRPCVWTSRAQRMPRAGRPPRPGCLRRCVERVQAGGVRVTAVQRRHHALPVDASFRYGLVETTRTRSRWWADDRVHPGGGGARSGAAGDGRTCRRMKLPTRVMRSTGGTVQFVGGGVASEEVVGLFVIQLRVECREWK